MVNLKVAKILSGFICLETWCICESSWLNACEFSLSMCVLQQWLYIIAQGQAQSPAYHLPSLSSFASKMSPRPVCFSNWPFLVKPSVEFRPIQHFCSQMCPVILKPHKNSTDITLQIAGNYVFASPGKYAQISLYNWSLFKIKAVWGFLVNRVMIFPAKGAKCWLHLGFLNLESLSFC